MFMNSKTAYHKKIAKSTDTHLTTPILMPKQIRSSIVAELLQFYTLLLLQFCNFR
jgi:hypothetical protein